MKNFKNKVVAGLVAGGSVLMAASHGFCAFSLPTLPVTDLETAGTAVAALVGAAVLIGIAIRMIKKA